MSYCDFADYYDLLTEDVDYKKQAKYLCDILKENGVDRGILLDLACGTATLSILMAQNGFDVIATDQSEDMLSIASQKINELNIKDVMLLCQPMQELELYGEVDVAICTLDSLNHLESFKDFNQTISRVSKYLSSNGIFVFDLNTPFKHRHVLGDNTYVIETDDVYCVWQNEYKKEDNTVDIYLDFFEKIGKKYKRTTQYITEKAYDIDVVKKCLSKNGLEIISIYDDMTRNKIKHETQRAVFVTRKVK